MLKFERSSISAAIAAAILLATIPCSPPASAQRLPHLTTEEAMAQILALAALPKAPESATIGAIAAKFGFTYQELGCNATENFRSLCQYQPIEHSSSVGNIVILALGQSVDPGHRGGRIVWSQKKREPCVRSDALADLFGKGSPRVDPAHFPHGTSTLPQPSTEWVYNNIPGAVVKASAVVTFSNNCVKQILLDF